MIRNIPMTDRHARSLIKGVTWRLTAMMDTLIIASIVTGSTTVALKIASIETFTKIFLFYLHERIWTKIRWRLKEKHSHKRSLAKATSWRIAGSVDTTMISWIVTGRIPSALQIGSIEVFTKITLFYLHERLWSHIGWGRNAMETTVEDAPLSTSPIATS